MRNTENLGAALAALEDGDYPGTCEVCWGAMVNGVCSDCLRPERSLWRALLDMLWQPFAEDWREHKRMVAKRRESVRLSKVVS